MKDEIEAAAGFLTQLVSQSNQPANISEDQLQTFKVHLVKLFEERFHDHWFPERPQRGQGFRCIRLNSASRPDPLIQKAACETGLDYSDLKLPVEFTMWVDPKEVSCRFGEHEGSYCTVASFGKESKVAVEPIETPQLSPRRLNRNRLTASPPRYRLNCFYPNYEPKGWYQTLSPPPPINYPKSRYVQPWGLAYVPAVRYLNNWPMGQMVKV